MTGSVPCGLRDTNAQERIKQLVLQAYAEYEEDGASEVA
jgi:hypothetical protein